MNIEKKKALDLNALDDVTGGYAFDDKTTPGHIIIELWQADLVQFNTTGEAILNEIRGNLNPGASMSANDENVCLSKMMELISRLPNYVKLDVELTGNTTGDQIAGIKELQVN